MTHRNREALQACKQYAYALKVLSRLKGTMCIIDPYRAVLKADTQIYVTLVTTLYVRHIIISKQERRNTNEWYPTQCFYLTPQVKDQVFCH